MNELAIVLGVISAWISGIAVGFAIKNYINQKGSNEGSQEEVLTVNGDGYYYQGKKIDLKEATRILGEFEREYIVNKQQGQGR